MPELAVLETHLPFPKQQGKVRDVYDLDAVLPGHLLLVATDRVSAFDVVLPTGVPGKGRLLTQLSRFWFDLFADVPNHLAGVEVADVPELTPYLDVLDARSTLVKRLDVVPFECVARGYLAGSGLVAYQATGTVCGVPLPPGLVEGSQLPEPIFTPATKAPEGSHDENVPFSRMSDALGEQLAARLRDDTLALYERAARHAQARGILLADTKLEWGRDASGDVLLADEIFTPDSSRYWDASVHAPGRGGGRGQVSFDKQPVRDYLAGLAWDRTPPAPPLPPDVIEGTRDRYAQALSRLSAP